MGRAFLLLVDVPVTPTQARHRALAARDAGLAGVVVSPSHLAAVGEPAGLTVASVVGYPSGRHHSLVKAAEARLAVQQGAGEIWLTPDATVDDPNTLLAEFVAVREAVPAPVHLAVLVVDGPHGEAAAEAARLAGADRVVSGASIRTDLPRTAVGADDLAGVIAALEAGADRVGVSELSALLDG